MQDALRVAIISSLTNMTKKGASPAVHVTIPSMTPHVHLLLMVNAVHVLQGKRSIAELMDANQHI